MCLKADDKVDFFPKVGNRRRATLIYFSNNSVILPFSDSYKLGRLKFDGEDVGVNIHEVHASLPPALISLKHRVGLMTDWCTFNLGHLLVDVMFSQYMLNLRLGYGQLYDFQLVSTSAIDPTSLEPSFGHGLCKHPMITLNDLFISKNGSIPSQAHKRRNLVCFKKLS